ncbi:type I polyketide synthase [Streptomyces sp. NBC_00878]|uniref:type I polyketide synthase n=1 Tax=Streptomyces sp. NBC_00878 TaxID=2975854 RepID=UPI00225B580A|nr:type I polyketide synthase [Streptomyces sp. NBC_00878]MCX4902867.1 SDR family NAD(P)-dependent oxidoreductase [Streptomyces sp. NBC_00878]
MNTSLDEAIDALRTALLENERLRRSNQQLTSAATEPLAVVGIGCRFPGGVEGPESLWRLVAEGRDAMTGPPADRGWQHLPSYDPGHQGAFLPSAADFDSGFFRISPREALAMDPQQRQLLEVSWEALERAGLDPASLRGSRTGVFVGGAPQEYGALLAGSPDDTDGYAITGLPASILSGRIAYTLGLEGPALTVDTACSSSLVALHLAARSLRAGECDLALVGGVLVMTTPAIYGEFDSQGGSASDGRCKAFADAADGTGWGEGAGVLVVERLSDARRNGHHVLAVVRGSAVNQDGASNGLTAPNGPSQQRVISDALAGAGLQADEVDAVEAHGTGTKLGDPIEAQALLATYGRGRPQERPLWIGSIKSNLGHTQFAAGIAGVIKMIMAIREGVLPRTLHVDEPTRQVDWTAGAVRVLTEEQPWPQTGRPRRAGVSSFGISGTNAHVILEQAPEPDREPDPVPDPEPSRTARTFPAVPVTLTARTPEALRAQAARLLTHLAEHPAPAPTLPDLAHALATTRTPLDHRAVLTATDLPALTRGLKALTDAEDTTALVQGTVTGGGVAVAFSGQGSQRVGMGRELYEAYEVFAAAFDEVCAAFDGLELKQSVFEGTAEELAETGLAQPALFAVEVALYRLLESWGIHADVVFGHSLGELVAAYVAGVWSLEDACRVVAARGRLMQALPSGGAMWAVEAEETEVQETPGVWLAAVNGPRAVVLSGEEDAVKATADGFAARGRRVKRLNVSHAFHSGLMDPMPADFARVLAEVTYAEPVIPVVSNITGEIAGEELTTPEYWARHVRAAVRFADGVRAVAGQGVSTVLEVGPDGSLLTTVRDTVPDLVTVPALRRDRGEREALTAALGQAYVHGVGVDWATVLGGGGRPVPLPTYAFQHRRYWPRPGSPAGSRPEDARRYRIAWRPTAPDSTELTGRWLLVTPDTEDTSAVAQALRDAGAEVETAPDARGAAGDYAGVVALPQGPADAVALVQDLRASGTKVPLWWLTRHAVAVTPGDTVRPDATRLWGLGQVVGLEEPGWWGGLIDLPALWDGGTGAALAAVLAGGTGGEDQLAVRTTGVFARRLMRAPLPGGTPARRWQPRGTVLITGGTGGVGANVARWAATEGARHLLLTSRRGAAAPGAAELGRELEALGASVTFAACDTGDRDALAATLADIPEEHPLTAVVHAAGVVRYTKVRDLTPEELDEVLTGKATGARHLDELTAHLDLDAFVLFSSGAAAWGGGSQGAYAAANAYLDGLAEARHAAGRPATSLAWGIWGGGGMGADLDEQSLARMGLALLDPALALAVMREAVEHDEPTLTVTDTDWSRFAPVYAGARRRPLIEDIPEAAEALRATDDAPEGPSDDSLRARLGRLTESERRAALLDLVRTRAAAVLGHTDTAEVSDLRAFNDLGFDSLTATELRDRLNTATGLKLPATLVFDHPNPAALATHLGHELYGGADPLAGTVAVRQADADDPLVVVGMACRLPGGVTNPDDLWRLVAEGRDAIGGAPDDRGWDAWGDTGGLQGGFLAGATGFDAEFFGISPREALAMDPQQRQLLEVSWEALERAGLDPAFLRGSRTGVFVGGTPTGYGALLGDGGEAGGYLLTGNSGSVMSGRIAYVLGLEGPALTVDTACSSSLVSLHLAGQALTRGECDLALVGGVAVMPTPGAFDEFDRQGGLASDGRCKAFADAADGTGWSEGVAFLVVERQSDARRNGHQVLAVVRGSAINQDGASNGLSAPNGPSQQRVIAQALTNAGLTPDEVDAVEAHGTGTRLGDPIEAQALLATYGQNRERPLHLGSLKSNIGHTQAVSGVAGVIKTVLALREGVLPQTLHVDAPSGQVDWSAGAVELLTQAREWPETGRPRRAGVSSFGISGTNAHVILEQAPEADPRPDPLTGPLPWILSGHTESALRAQATVLSRYLMGHQAMSHDAVAASLAVSRAGLECRAVVVGGDREALERGVAAVADGSADPGVVRGRAGTGGVVFVFPGQGSQWAGMALELLDSSPVFAARMAECEQALSAYVDWSLKDVLQGELERVDVVQPVLWAVMVSLAEVWRSYGVEPAAVVGHSQGEIAAAVVAGALSLEDGARVVALRSRAILALSGQGGMVSVQLPAGLVREELKRWDGRIDLAAVNGPSAVVVAGEPGALDELLAWAEEDGVRARRIAVDYASHSAHVDAVRQELADLLKDVAPKPSRVAFYSCVTAGRLETVGLDADYWFRNLRQPVEFEQTTRALLEQGHTLFVEVTPHPVLTSAVQETAEDHGRQIAVTGTLRRGEGGPQRLLLSLGEAYVHGAPVDWTPCLPDADDVDLPTYAFQHKHYWMEMPPTAGVGRPVDAWRYRVTWRRLTQTGNPALDGRWLLVDPEGDGREVAEALRAAGAEVDVADAVREGTYDGVVCLPTTAVEALGVVRELDAAGMRAPLWWLTRGGASVSSGDAVRAEATRLWGLGQVVGLEQPDRWGGLIDLPAEWSDGAAASLTALLAGAAGGEDQLAVRGPAAYARRLVRAPLTERVPVRRWQPHGTVLITGGTGGIAAHLARRLAAEGAEHLLLLGRRGGAAPGAAELAEEIRALGAEVSFAACDVTDRDTLAAVLDGVPEQWPLTAVLHTASSTSYGPVLGVETGELVAGMAAKADGARHLDELTAHLDLDAFVLFSSGAAVWGSAGNGVYAAANAYLDGLAHERRARGLTATSVAWGGWADGGMLSDFDQLADQLQRMGVRPMRPESAMDVLWEAVEYGETTLTVSDMDWERFAPVYAMSRRRPLIEEIPEAARVLSPSGDSASGGDDSAAGQLRASLAGLGTAEQRAALLDLVRGRAAAVLGHDEPAQIAGGRPFKDLGFDSLTATELRNRLAAATGLKLPATLVFDHPTPTALAEYLRDELLGAAVEMSATPRAGRAADNDDPLVVVGMACRYPGGVRGPEDLWRLLAEGRDEMADFPTDRGWDALSLYDPGRRTTLSGQGAFLYDAGDFDAEFFGISPREALSMDPQQRLLLEVSWEALERTGIAPLSLRGSRTGVFVGGTPQEYGALLMNSASLAGGYALTSSSGSVMSGRVSYVLGLEGPAVTVDTACSSSLVSLHLAGQALRAGECDLALAGGVTVMATPGSFAEFANQGGLSSDGRCKAFADTADGTGWGEGVGIVVLERLSDARRNGHRVLATVRGSAVNQDGASNGLTAPNGPSQQRVIRAALDSAGLTPADVDAVEAHGTGTKLGDPIEAQALLATYGKERNPKRPLWLGSVKSNIGHTQYAAGVAGVIKTILAMRAGVLPRTLHVDEPTRQVDWSAGGVRLLTEEQTWPETDGPRRAGVSSFGISGTNAHVILEHTPEPEPEPEPVEPSEPATPLVPWLLSGHTEAALRDQAAALLTDLEARPDVVPLDVAHSLATTRSGLAHRAAVVADSPAVFLDGLRSLAAGTPNADVLTDTARETPLAVVFPGQGSQRVGMGRELYGRHPGFAAAFDEVCAAFGGLLDRPLRDLVLAEDTDRAVLDRTGYTQPALFAVEVALYRLLESWGVRADVLIGHSIGELVAAHVAGVWTLPDACRVVAARARLMQSLPAGGAMLAVHAAETEVVGVLAARADGGDIGIAAVNSPTAVVVSGPEPAILGAAAEFVGRGHRTKVLPVSHAFHSALMEPMLADFAAELARVEFHEPNLTVISNVTGGVASAAELRSPGYWVGHVRGSVRFADGVRTLLDRGVRTFLEAGPGSALTAMADETAAEHTPDPVTCVAALRSAGRGEADALVTAVTRLALAGRPADWAAYYAGRGARAVDLPTYTFQHRRYWLRVLGGAAQDVTALGLDAAHHPLLGAVTTLPETCGLLFTGSLAADRHPWLADHALGGIPILPGSAFLELALHAGRYADCDRVDELVVHAPLALTGTTALRLGVDPADSAGRRAFTVHARTEEPGAEWTRHAGGVLTAATVPAPAADATWPPPGARPVPLDDFYLATAERGLEYGPAFHGLTGLWQTDGALHADVVLPESLAREEASDDDHALHPALLDAALQPLGLGILAAQDGDATPVPAGLPFAWSGVSLHAAGAHALRAKLTAAGDGTVAVELTTPDGQPVLSVDALTLRTPSAPQAPAAGADLYRFQWPQLPVPAASDGASWALVGLDPRELRSCLAAATGRDVVPYPDSRVLADALASGAPVPAVALAWCDAPDSGDPAADAHALGGHTLALLQEWLADDRLTDVPLVLITHGAVATGPDDDAPHPARAAVWGLARAVQSEHPGRLVLADLGAHLDGSGDPEGVATALAALPAAVAGGEPQLALRAGTVHAPRLARTAVAAPAAGGAAAPAFDPDGTVLVTGAIGGIGALVARRLVEHHGVRHLLLTGRRGPDTPGAGRLAADLTAAGARVTLAACDVADRAALSALLAGLDAPLAGVLHLAGVVEDGLALDLTPQRLDAVLRPKADAAWHLHELTAGDHPVPLVLFSSAAGVLGSPGQANYAAANAFLDALAQHRQALGLPVVSLAWGPWQGVGGMADAADGRARGTGGGLLPFTADTGLAALDQALTVAGEPVLVPLRLALKAAAGLPAEQIPAVLRGLVRGTRRPVRQAEAGRPVAGGGLAALEPAARADALLRLVRVEASRVLGHDSPDGIDADRAFGDLGFDSLTSVELRNRLADAAGLRLQPTLVFDHPTPAALAVALDRRFTDPAPRSGSTAAPADPTTSVADAVEALYRHAVSVGEYGRAAKVLMNSAGLRPSFTSAQDVGRAPGLVRLGDGDGSGRPALIGLPSTSVWASDQEFVALARPLRGLRDTYSLMMPGFASGELVARSVEAAAEHAARTILRTLDGAPFALAGRSSGGSLAYAVATRLEELGSPAAGVAMLDTYLAGMPQTQYMVHVMESRSLEREAEFGRMTGLRLTAMASYFSLFETWQPNPLATPGLLLRASRPVQPDPEHPQEVPDEWQTVWPVPLKVADVPGDHHSMIEEHGETTAAVIHDWLTGLGS